MTVTIFTATYNRAYILPKLYISLCAQNCKDFEWLIVDDGSQDETSNLAEKWVQEAPFEVRYIQQKNGGKHRAINRGVSEARGELFFIVDSDDQLPQDSIGTIISEYSPVKQETNLCGVCGLKAYFDGKPVGGENDFGTLICDCQEVRYKYGVKGDLSEVFKTEVLREFPFPEIEGEKFCSESVGWQRVAGKYKFKYFSKITYLCDYLPDGLSAKATLLRMMNPIGATLCYSEQTRTNIPFIWKMKGAINYWRFYFCKSPIKKVKIGKLWAIMLPIGYLLHCLDELRRK